MFEGDDTLDARVVLSLNGGLVDAPPLNYLYLFKGHLFNTYLVLI